MIPAVELRDVRAAYGRIEVVHGVSLVVPPATVFALLGPNGGGKTTTLKVISGRMRPTSGCVHIAGSHVNGAAPEKLARAGVCSIPEGRGIFPNLTVAENLRMMTYRGVRTRDIEEQSYARFPRLGERRSQLAGTMSGGEQQMCAIGRALMSSPKLLLLDEPSAGLAPVVVQQVFELVNRIRTSGLTVLIVEQNVQQVLRVVDRAYLLEAGSIRASGTSAEIMRTDIVKQAYLGV